MIGELFPGSEAGCAFLGGIWEKGETKREINMFLPLLDIDFFKQSHETDAPVLLEKEAQKGERKLKQRNAKETPASSAREPETGNLLLNFFLLTTKDIHATDSTTVSHVATY